jgi:hypothetical protein
MLGLHFLSLYAKVLIVIKVLQRIVVRGVSMKKMLSETHPHLSSEWAENKSMESYSRGSKYKALWRCQKEGHLYRMMITNKVKGQGCSYCSGKSVLRGFNDLNTTHPELAQEWVDDDVLPTEVNAGSKYRAKWKCQNDHTWRTSVNHRSKSKTGCPYCAGKKVWVGFNDLATVRPDLVEFWHPDNPIGAEEALAGGNYDALWICKKGHETKSKIYNRMKTGCSVCSGRSVISGDNDFATIYPDLAREWHPENNLSPNEVTAVSGRKVKWLCPNGHTYSKVIANRTKHGQGCHYCSGRKTLSGYNDLKSTHPHLIQMWDDPKDMREYVYGSGYEASWKCASGHSFKRVLHHMVKSSTCPVCTGKAVLYGYNDLTTTHPEIAEEWADEKLGPKEVTAGSNKIVQWKCKNGHKWKTSVNNRTKKRPTGCPDCWQLETSSRAEREIWNYVAALGGEPQKDREVLSGRELDIYLPDHNLAIEYNGLYWHSESKGKDQWYHFNKWKDCKDVGIQLIQVWEDDYNRNPHLVKRMIAHRMGVLSSTNTPERTTYFTKLADAEALLFLEENHLQGAHEGSQCYGLRSIEDNELLAVISVIFSSENKEIEITRFATCEIMPEGFYKIVKHLLKISSLASAKRVIFCLSNDYPDEAMFKSNGFIEAETSDPACFYLRNGFREVYPDESEEGITEDKCREEKTGKIRHPRIWDSGSTLWVMDLAYFLSLKR